MNPHDITNALMELELEGAIQSGWSTKGVNITMAPGDTEPTEQEMQDALVRRDARLASEAADEDQNEDDVLTLLSSSSHIWSQNDLIKLRDALNNLE